MPELLGIYHLKHISSLFSEQIIIDLQVFRLDPVPVRVPMEGLVATCLPQEVPLLPDTGHQSVPHGSQPLQIHVDGGGWSPVSTHVSQHWGIGEFPTQMRNPPGYLKT